jgi:hypothetical protein
MNNVIDITKLNSKPSEMLPTTISVPANEKPKEEPKPQKKMKKWSDDPSTLVPYSKLISPLKDIINKGYKLIRNDVKSFDYEGYNIGKNELQLFPSPKNQFTEKHLAKLKNIKLMDVVLHITFLLGVEQGRRSERQEQKSTETLINTLEQYRETNKNLRYQIDELKAFIVVKDKNPTLSHEELMQLVKIEVDNNRPNRIAAIKTDLELDPTRSSFKIRTPQRAKFNDLMELSKTLNKSQYEEHWPNILKEYGWTIEQWDNKCKKKNQKVVITD